MDTQRKEYRTVVISDVHLGTKYSKVTQVCNFLSSLDCQRLILNGDTIDGWQLRKNGYSLWGPEQSRFFRIILKMIENRATQVYILRGNHDDFLDRVIPMNMGNLEILKDMIIETGGKKYFVTHGDVFDSVTSNMRWVAKLGDVAYNILLKINTMYNRIMVSCGRPYYSFSQALKDKVKKAVANASDFDAMLTDMAKVKGCDGVICGLIHRPEDRVINGIHYLNSGDWVETCSALLEDMRGNWSVYRYAEDSAGSVII